MNRSRLLCVITACLLISGIFSSAEAALVSRLGGQAAYDDVLNITWITDAALSGRGTWDEQVVWAENFTLGGFDDWRLASMSVTAGFPTGVATSVVDCNVATELACRDNELGYMFYHNLGGSFDDNLQGNHTIGDVTLTGILNPYWSGT